MKTLSTVFLCFRIASVSALVFFLAACGSSSESDLSGDLSSATVESTTVDESSDFTPSITVAVGSDGTLEFSSAPVDVNGDGTNEEVTISSVTATDYSGSVSIAPLDVSAGKAVTYEFECRDTTTSSSISPLSEDIDNIFPGKSSCTTDCGDTVRTKKIGCAVACETFTEHEGRYAFILVLAAVLSGWTYQSIVNMVIFLSLTC